MEEISLSELAAILAQGPIKLLDVRLELKYLAGHIAGAESVPLEKIASFTGDKQEKIYLICTGGVRSKQAAVYLADQGYQVVNVSKGMSEWKGPQVSGKA